MENDAGSSPETILRLALSRRDHLDYRGVVALCDAASVLSCFRAYVEVVRPVTEGDYRVHYPDASEMEVREWVATQNARRESQIPRALPDINGYAELVALTPEEFMRRYLEREDPRWEIARRLRQRGRPVPVALSAPQPGVYYEIGPAERVGDTDVRLTYRQLFEGHPEISDEGSESMRREDTGEWRLVARRSFLHPGGSVSIRVPPEFADLFDE
jgi:hypothetical protein